ncbi:MAG: hypothetical protein IPI28_00385 [Candidatus Omnitrophica bacterium]|nr:hypothetical protein [Candidatus Omnitrophota bacterium]
MPQESKISSAWNGIFGASIRSTPAAAASISPLAVSSEKARRKLRRSLSGARPSMSRRMACTVEFAARWPFNRNSRSIATSISGGGRACSASNGRSQSFKDIIPHPSREFSRDDSDQARIVGFQ